MKAGKQRDFHRQEINTITLNRSEEDRRQKNSILITVLPILSMIASILPGIMNKSSGLEIAKVAILTLILTTVSTFYIRLNMETISTKRLAKTIITLSYLGSIVLLLLIPEPYLYCFWMLGGLVVAMTIDNNLGLLFHFSLSFILGISLEPKPEIIIHILIIGVVMNLLAGALRVASTAIYAMIIILSTNVTLSFVINNFIFDTKVSYNYLYSLFSILAVLVTAFLLCLLYNSITANDRSTMAEEEIAVAQAGEALLSPSINPAELSAQSIILEHSETIGDAMSSKEEEITKPERIIGTSSNYDVLCSVTNELLLQLKEHSESLYAHALHIADLSERAAKRIEASEQLAKAGGLYHEIGKLKGRNYIEEGLLIAEDYAFPEELKAIIREHNIKYDKPRSVEAAIVMLSDSVVSTIEYIERTEEKKHSTNKIIDNIFQMRMDKGTFDGVNLTLKDFKLLKEFYQKEFQSDHH